MPPVWPPKQRYSPIGSKYGRGEPPSRWSTYNTLWRSNPEFAKALTAEAAQTLNTIPVNISQPSLPEMLLGIPGAFQHGFTWSDIPDLGIASGRYTPNLYGGIYPGWGENIWLNQRFGQEPHTIEHEATHAALHHHPTGSAADIISPEYANILANKYGNRRRVLKTAEKLYGKFGGELLPLAVQDIGADIWKLPPQVRYKLRYMFKPEAMKLPAWVNELPSEARFIGQQPQQQAPANLMQLVTPLAKGWSAINRTYERMAPSEGRFIRRQTSSKAKQPVAIGEKYGRKVVETQRNTGTKRR